jgi:kumamolisin
MERHVLDGSLRSAKAGAARIRDISPDEVIEATVTLAGPPLPEPGRTPAAVLDREALATQIGAAERTMETARSVFERFGLTVTDESPLTRSMRVSGTAAQMEAAFEPGLGVYATRDQGEYRGRDGALSVPAELKGIVTGVFGLDERRMAHRGQATPAAAKTAPPLSIADLARRYAFPPGDAGGITVGIAEFGGGYFESDLQAFCEGQNLAMPTVTVVPVGLESLSEDQIRSLPSRMRDYELGCSEEVNMDVQIVAGMCPGADIAVYFAPGSQKGWVDLLNAVIADQANDPRVLSVSWGAAEDTSDWAAGAVKAIDERLQAAALLGITVCVAAGDDGSGDDQATGAHVNFPASSPNVLAVGGTQLDASGTEVVWWQSPGYRTGSGGGATGGGVSTVGSSPTSRPWPGRRTTS